MSREAETCLEAIEWWPFFHHATQLYQLKKVVPQQVLNIFSMGPVIEDVTDQRIGDQPELAPLGKGAVIYHHMTKHF